MEFAHNPIYAPDAMEMHGRNGTQPGLPYNQPLQTDGYHRHVQTSNTSARQHAPTGQNAAGGPSSDQTAKYLIVKRCFSVVFILLDVAFDWLQYSDMAAVVQEVKTTEDTVNDFSHFFRPTKLRATSDDVSNACNVNSKIFTIVYIAFSAFGTIFAIVQIVNLIGETIHDATGGNRGFQIFHGYYEVCIIFILEELPQIVTTFFFASSSCECKVDQQWMLRVILSAAFAALSNYIRKSTCKKEEHPCCAVTWDWPYCCCYIPVCGYGEDNCKVQTVNLCDCSDCGCFFCGELGCCDPREKDPKCADMIADKLRQLHVVSTIVVVLQITIFDCFGSIF